ncbi:MAG: hypothetical protein FVQ83_03400 [Chloroflexi bacterium]|nr:hypothetical protein [Chloroflexota bacterium]
MSTVPNISILRNLQRLLWSAFLVSTATMGYYILTQAPAGDIWALTYSIIRIGILVILLSVFLVLIWLRRRLSQYQNWFAQIQHGKQFLALTSIVGLIFFAGSIYFILPAFKAFSTLKYFAPTYFWIAPFTSWGILMTILTLLGLFNLRASMHPDRATRQRNFIKLITISLSAYFALLYLTSLAAGWLNWKDIIFFRRVIP